MFSPDQKTLDHYADVLVNFALNSGRGIKKGDVVFLQVPESAKPLLISLYRQVLRSGGHPIIQYLPDSMEKIYFEEASEDQLQFFPTAYLRGKAQVADHVLTIIAETDKHELEGIDPKRIMTRRLTSKPYRRWLDRKEQQDKFTWTLGLYPTLAMSDEANLSLDDCWQQVIQACYLDQVNPVEKWQQVFDQINQIKNNLNRLPIAKLHLVAKDTDLFIGLGLSRQWVGGSGRNIPSFEIFTSPDWRQTDGHIFFDLPLYRDGQVIRDIYLEFHQGRVVSARAKAGQTYLQELIKVTNSDKIGEYSLTDIRFSKISKFMAETLYDENYGGDYGNTHLALGSSYHETCLLDIKKMKPADFKKLGFNDSVVHTDIIATTNRTVTAIMTDGSEKIIYQNGQFQL